jgi:dihydrofolate reductase
MQLDKVVFSHSLQQVSWPNTRICREDAAPEVRRMKTQSDIALRTMGSLSVARQLATAGLVDRLRLMTFP